MPRTFFHPSVSFLLFFLGFCLFSFNGAYKLDAREATNRSPKNKYSEAHDKESSVFSRIAEDAHLMSNLTKRIISAAESLGKVEEEERETKRLLQEFEEIRERKHHEQFLPSVHSKHSKHQAQKSKSKKVGKIQKHKPYEPHHRSSLKSRREKAFKKNAKRLTKSKLSSSLSSKDHNVKVKYHPSKNKSILKNSKKEDPDVIKGEGKTKHSDNSTEKITEEHSTSIVPTAEPSEEEILIALAEIHTELIKQKILRLLKLEKPPQNKHKVLPTIPSFLQGSLIQEAQADEPEPDDYLEPHVSQALVFAEEEPLQCPKHSAKCVQFKLGSFSRQKVHSAELWLFKEFDIHDHYNHTFVVYELQSPNGNSSDLQLRKAVGSFQTGIKKGWVKVDLRHTVGFWVSKPHRNNGIQILCKTCKTGPGRRTPISTTSEVRPLLVIRFGAGKSRTPRGTGEVCHRNNANCCKQPLTIDLRKYWSDWIVYPTSFKTSFCRGSCKQRYHHLDSLTHHTNFVLSQREVDTPCCVPTKMKKISLLYKDDTRYTQSELELVVTECGCAT